MSKKNWLRRSLIWGIFAIEMAFVPVAGLSVAPSSRKTFSTLTRWSWTIRTRSSPGQYRLRKPTTISSACAGISSRQKFPIARDRLPAPTIRSITSIAPSRDKNGILEPDEWMNDVGEKIPNWFESARFITPIRETPRS